MDMGVDVVPIAADVVLVTVDAVLVEIDVVLVVVDEVHDTRIKDSTIKPVSNTQSLFQYKMSLNEALISNTR